MRQKSQFPFWGAIAIPAGALWGPLIGAGIGYLFGNVVIGAAIGAGIGVGIGLSLFAAAIVIASSRFQVLRMIGRTTGMLAGGVTAALWVAVIWFPVGGFMLEGYNVAVGAVMAALGLVAAIAAWHGHATVIFFCFVTSFFGIGAFALNVDHWFRIFGVLDLLLFAASVMIWSSRRSEKPNP